MKLEDKIEVVKLELIEIEEHYPRLVKEAAESHVRRFEADQVPPDLWTCGQCKFFDKATRRDDFNCLQIPELNRAYEETNCELFRLQDSVKESPDEG